MDSLVTTEWLARELDGGTIVVLDASAHATQPDRDARAEFLAGHIPGARFLDLGTFKDAGSSVPNALPTHEQVAARLASLGVSPDSRVVLYDDSAVKTSARAWFILHMNGVADVAILDGGLAKWKAEGRPLEAGETVCDGCTPGPIAGDWSRVRSKDQVLANIDTRAEQVIDARDAGRFTGETVDAVHGLPGGHIPGACNLFFRDLYNADGTFRSEDELRALFERAGVDLDRPIVTSCGSGVTASVLLFALHRLGVEDAALYDGSWSEWGADPSTPKETGAAA
ncbi:3-mercaptopyruvate sulfurtransferase [Tsuneonella dongtanensis]|uniref:Sulfurtransferase n=1 Tax=Tsuneonella dongtanensis TaxID=692370 RepID=A0A1B2AD21_9SPHN|nr:3-mercaptopyruvate sulfurtransferase [Tsuneonella dongtanensis]ANY20043.1 3-mercaptopyruvate sulfurtransferase [Tsuneonella dongtanensis]